MKREDVSKIIPGITSDQLDSIMNLHGAKGETERHRGSYWGQNAIADHKDELEKFAHDAAKQFLGGNK